jgi:selenocysteine lyase/cysteine desulfurase
MRLADDASRCDASPAWLSWVGACAALQLFGRLDPSRVERHCLDLAAHLTSHAHALGLPRVTDGPASHIVVLRTDHADRIAHRLRQHRVRATALGDRVRFGFHYYNNDHDVSATLRALQG